MIIDSTNKIGFVLGGGGVRALESQSGAIQCLVDNGIKPDFIYGCSGGALTGAVYFSGVKAIDFFKSIDIGKVIGFAGLKEALFGDSLLSSDAVERMLFDLLGDRVFENFVVNMTDVETRDVYYAFGNVSTVTGSMSIPKVFQSKILTGTVYKNTTPYRYDAPMKNVQETLFLFNRPVYDGGVYDLYPMPEYESIAKAKHIFVLACPNGKTPEEMNDTSRVGQAVNWIVETTERGFRQLLPVYGGRENVSIIRPKPISSPLLGWSDGFTAYYEAYENMSAVIKKIKMEK